MKKSILALISSILVLALLGGAYYFAVKWEPEEEDVEEEKKGFSAFVTFIDINIEDIASVTINTGVSEYTIHNDEPLKIEGYSSPLITSADLNFALEGTRYITGSHKIENASDKLSEYGLDRRSKFFTIRLKDGTEKTILLGNQTNYNDSYFAMIEGEDTVYIIPTYKMDSVFSEPSALRNTDICTFNTDAFDEIVISRGNETIISFARRESEKSEDDPASMYDMLSYNITYPYKNLPASADMLTALFEKFSDITAFEITEENPKDLSIYGLSSPTLLTVKEGEITHRIKLGKKVEGNKVYLMYNDLPVVYIARCDFYDAVTNLEVSEYLEKFIHLFNIASVESVSIDIEKEVHKLEIEGKDKNAVYKLEGKKINEKAFKGIYQATIGLRLSDITDVEPSGEEKCTITFTFKDKTSKAFTYYKYDDRQCIVKSDAGINCLTLTKSIDSILELINKEN